MMTEIYQIDDLKKLEVFLKSVKDADKLRKMLFKEFLKYADYKNVTDWNKAVKLCESLAIIGWGNYEPIEALKGKYFNGNPMTFFINKFGECRFVDAIWSKRTTGYTMEEGRTSYHFSPNQIDNKQTLLWNYETKEYIQDVKFKSQSNWIPKNPIWFERTISNCYENSKEVIESIKKDLQFDLNEKMRPEKYGNTINRIVINHCHSFYDNANCKENFLITESEIKLSSQKAWEDLHKMFPKSEIKKHGYLLRNRFEYGPFRSDTGRINITIYLERAFSRLSHQEQKEKFSEYVLIGLNTLISKLKKKKVNYDFDLMLEDFSIIIEKWKTKKHD
jgi:hypothetical protein